MRPRLRIMTFNVHSCVGTDGKLDPARIADVIAACEPDIVGLQELDLGRARTRTIDQAAVIASLLNMKALFHPAMHKAEEKYGDAILTALPTETKKTGALPSIGEPRGAAWVEIQWNGMALQVFNTHLGLRRRERMTQITTLLGSGWLNHPDCAGHPRILMGDLNAVPASGVYRRITRNMHDIWKSAGKTPQATFPSRYPFFRLDHIFLSDELRAVNAHVRSTPFSRSASDHLPLIGDVEAVSLPSPTTE